MAETLSYQSDKSFLYKEEGSEGQKMPGWFREDVLSWKPKDGEDVSFLTLTC